MSVTEGVVLYFQLVLEIAVQLMISLRTISSNAILNAQLLLTNVTQILTAWGRQAEGILKAVLCRRVGYQEVVQTLRQTGNHHDGILAPFVHLDKQLVERIHLIGITVGQQFLHIIEEKNAILGFLHIVVPLVDKALIVYCVNHRQLGLVDNLVLIEIVAYHFCQGRLTRSRLTDNNRIDAQTHVHDVLARVQIGVGVDYRLQLLLHIGKSHQTVQHVLRNERFTTPTAKLGY